MKLNQGTILSFADMINTIVLCLLLQKWKSDVIEAGDNSVLADMLMKERGAMLFQVEIRSG